MKNELFFDSLNDMSVEDLIELKKIIDKRIEKIYYMHSFYCDTVDNKIVEHGFNHNERSVKLTTDEFIEGDYSIPYCDADYMYGYHVSFFSEKKKATEQEMLSLEGILYDILNYELFKSIDERINVLNQEIIEKQDDIVVQETLKITQKKEIQQICKNYLRSKKLKTLK